MSSLNERLHDPTDLGVIRRVVLNDPINGRDVQTPGSYVRAQENPGLSVTKLEEGLGTLALLLLALVRKDKKMLERILS